MQHIPDLILQFLRDPAAGSLIGLIGILTGILTGLRNPKNSQKKSVTSKSRKKVAPIYSDLFAL